ncbi:MAG: glycosyltransferase [Flavobacterium sp.]|nr:glycosyltransferase [Flavobacterium sp.]
MISNKLISIIIPTFNRAQLIEETLVSIERQSYKNWECIVIDDGSKDNTKQIVDNFVKKDNRFHFFVRPNNRKKGGCTCRNIGFENAIGEYILFLDSDDILEDFCLQRRMENVANLDFVVFQSKLFTDTPQDAKFIPNLLHKPTSDFERFITKDYPWNISATLLKKEFLLQNNGIWDENLAIHQDIDFYLNILSKKPNYKKIDAIPDVAIRMGNEGKVSNTISEEKLKSKILLLKKINMYVKDSEEEIKNYNKYVFSASLELGRLILKSQNKTLYKNLLKTVQEILGFNYACYLFLESKLIHMKELKKLKIKFFNIFMKIIGASKRKYKVNDFTLGVISLSDYLKNTKQ